jgi:hypothetical protein
VKRSVVAARSRPSSSKSGSRSIGSEHGLGPGLFEQAHHDLRVEEPDPHGRDDIYFLPASFTASLMTSTAI